MAKFLEVDEKHKIWSKKDEDQVQLKKWAEALNYESTATFYSGDGGVF